MDFAHARTMMVDNQIRTEDVTDWDVLRAFLTVPREAFVPEDKRALAYIGKDLPLPAGRRLMAPSSFARLLQLLLIGRGDVVLDVGCGTGYAAAIMSQLAGKVVALEEEATLAELARTALASHAGSNVELVQGKLGQGWAPAAPYDRILFQGAVEELPAAFIEQLRDGGRMVVVEGHGNAASARLYLKEGGTVSNRFGFNCSVPPLPGFARPPQFVF
ncbi:protein-L-isoaspartate O-methyltransferase family protein [Aureimonas leprariae]|uniref:Protein-L-isoaspartate O-methyltransferase n=1 Tax=Plantimonas leprariae TaxID=2615207 RepID=A0A7V7TY68_9HYPH|nr:protein-L-isoaspartate O-methyltransferase [Aureimonas leprariae]KAB0681996.1 protein-L-isoaspartate O-methyltransferase [Aureimonas leprariae]